ncbi:urokinase plasminogen activator surface receptor-like [Lampris incognitus]|uniref:urokinase plasminogen activator surface receptor-like n=1 Tax=Lampris incognitus TaxID=2546036 RepID=UPI0024B5C2BF|nr:urokinase plasminogen activator surface receptor-like [Lampris incognitus]
MYLLALILGSVLLPKAYTLRCHECVPTGVTACTSTQKTCTGSDVCGSARVIQYLGGSEVADVNAQSCTSSAECISGSINFGQSRTVVTTACCSTDLCNGNPAPKPRVPAQNGKKCYACDTQACNGLLNCLGDEDRCISGEVTTGGQAIRVKGCASASICSGSGSGQVAGITTKISCCQGDLCNSARGIGVSLLLLVAPMVCFTLFS